MTDRQFTRIGATQDFASKDRQAFHSRSVARSCRRTATAPERKGTAAAIPGSSLRSDHKR